MVVDRFDDAGTRAELGYGLVWLRFAAASAICFRYYIPQETASSGGLGKAEIR